MGQIGITIVFAAAGERRIRVHTLCLPVTNTLSEVHARADQRAIIGLIAKLGVYPKQTMAVYVM